MAPYAHTDQEVVPAVNAKGHRVESLLIETPSKGSSDISGDTDQYHVRVIYSRWDASGNRLPEDAVVEWRGSEVLTDLMAQATNNGENLADVIQRIAYEQAVVKGSIPSGGTIT